MRFASSRMRAILKTRSAGRNGHLVRRCAPEYASAHAMWVTFLHKFHEKWLTRPLQFEERDRTQGAPHSRSVTEKRE